MDYLALKKQFVFLNRSQALVQVHASKVKNTSFDIWTEGKSKKYRETVRLLEQGLEQLKDEDFPPIVVVAASKLGSKSYSSYDHVKDVIYFSNHFDSEKEIEEKLKNSDFKARNLVEVLRHELGHKLHWDAVKRFYRAHKSRYNNINEAKHELDAKLEEYIAKQSPIYLATVVSIYSYTSYLESKKLQSLSTVNEIIAEVWANKNKVADKILIRLIEEELNYGRKA